MGLIDSSGRFWFYQGVDGTSFRARRQIGQGWGSFKQLLTGFDFNGDKRTDIIAVTRSGELILYPGNGNATFGTSRQIGHGFGSMVSIWAVRNGINKRPTIYALNSSGTLYAYKTNGSGTITGTQRIPGNHA